MTNEFTATGGAIPTPGKIIAVHLNYPSRAAQRGRTPAQPQLLHQARLLDRRVGRHARAAGRHRTARLRGRDRAHHRRARAARHARATAGATWHPSPRPTISASTTCAPPTRARTCARRAATGSPRSARPSIPADRIGEDAWRVRTWVNGELVQDDTIGDAALPLRPARGRPLAAHDARDRRRHPHRHSGGFVGHRAGRRRRGRGRCARGARRTLDRPARDDRHPRHRTSSATSARSPRSTTCSGSRHGAAKPSSRRRSPPGVRRRRVPRPLRPRRRLDPPTCSPTRCARSSSRPQSRP